MGALGRTACLLGALAATALLGVWSPAGATAEADPGGGRAGATWGACGSWWSQTPARSESGTVCAVDGLVSENGRPTQLAEPLVTLSRYVCVKRAHPRAEEDPFDCTSEDLTGTVRRSEMTVDPLLRRATIRGSLGGCFLDVEFVGQGPLQPQGGLWQSYGATGATPAVSIGGNHTLTSSAGWWGTFCGQTVAPVSGEEGEGSIFRGADVSLNGFVGNGGERDGHGHG